MPAPEQESMVADELIMVHQVPVQAKYLFKQLFRFLSMPAPEQESMVADELIMVNSTSKGQCFT